VNGFRYAGSICLSVWLAPLSGCPGDGYLGVEGRVFEWVAAPQGAVAFVDIDTLETVLPAKLVPLAGASIVVEPWLPQERAKHAGHPYAVSRGATDSEGYFKLGRTAPPSEFDATLTVSAPGFSSLERTFRHDRLRHKAVIVLLRTPQQ
jgi:hypothetical protein